MRASATKILDLLQKSPQFIVPIYQRMYSWQENQCQKLWDDLIRTGKESQVLSHFMGSIVYVEKGLYHVSSQSELLVIDGQQRLTTVSIILAALSKSLPSGEEPINGFSKEKLTNYYLLNSLEKGDKEVKLLLSQTDKNSLLSVIKNQPWPDPVSKRIEENFNFFSSKIESLGGDIQHLCNGLSKLMVVDVALDRENDNPQLIFESMNSTGLELSQADLIRNFILMRLEPEVQERLYNQYWRSMELAFGQEHYSKHFDKFMRHFLTVLTGEIPKISLIYEAFKIFFNKRVNSPENLESLLDEMKKYSSYYCAVVLSKESEPLLQSAFSDLRELKADVSYPLILKFYHDYRQKIIDSKDFECMVRLIESYVFRRAICSINPNSMNKTFSSFGKNIDSSNYLESVQAGFLLLDSYRRFPANEEFIRELKNRDLYNIRTRSYWLRRLENFGRKERVILNEYTIEHIMPQNSPPSQSWQSMLGENWEEVHNSLLHTLGNLTLTRYNSEYSDHDFNKKRDMSGGFKVSPLNLNEGLGQLAVWDRDAILERSNKLANKALDVWPPVSLGNETLAKFNTKKRSKTTPKETGLIAKLLLEIEKNILDLDPIITQDALQDSTVYKAETEFLTVYPKDNHLELVLDIDYQELDDPQGLAKSYLEGETLRSSFSIQSMDDISYIIGLVRQGFEKQLELSSDE